MFLISQLSKYVQLCYTHELIRDQWGSRTMPGRSEAVHLVLLLWDQVLVRILYVTEISVLVLMLQGGHMLLLSKEPEGTILGE